MNTVKIIRKEIINRINKRHLSEQAKNELVSILSFLDTLEKELVKDPTADFKETEKKVSDAGWQYEYDHADDWRKPVEMGQL